MIKQLIALAPLLGLLGIGPCLGGCATLEGNGGYVIKYGTSIEIGHHTEKSDETQVARSTWDFKGILEAVIGELTTPEPSPVSDGG